MNEPWLSESVLRHTQVIARSLRDLTGRELLPAVADRAASKQGQLLPGSHIPVISPEQLAAEAVDTLLVLPWNLIEELRQQLPGSELVTAIPELCHWGGNH
jgi:hypothetical protein